jgi:hypothetical protein
VSSSGYKASNIGTSYAYFTFALPATYLFSGGVTYAIVLERASWTTGHVDWGVDVTSPTYSRGYVSIYDGSTWTNYTGYDACFQIYVRGKWDYTTSTATVKDIVTDDWSRGSYRSSDRTQVSYAGATEGGVKFSNNERANQVIERVCKYGASSGTEPIYFAVWESAVPYLFSKSSYRYFWNVRLRDLLPDEQGYTLTRSLSQMYNKVSAIFSNETGKQDVTTWSSDSDSQSDFGMTREMRVQAGNVTETVATILRDLTLQDKKDAYQASTLTLKNVLNENNLSDDLWKVRAGDMIRMVDVDPDSNLTDTSVFDDTRRMFIIETEYTADQHTLRVTPDLEKRELDVIATQLGVS